MRKRIKKMNSRILLVLISVVLIFGDHFHTFAESPEQVMSISSEGVNFIASFEGLSLKAYKAVPTEKYWTIGYGHYGPDVKEGDVITKEQALVLFKNELASFDAYLNDFKKENNIELNQKQYDALLSFSYNVGTGWMKSSTIRTYLLNGITNYTNEQITNAFAMWNKSGGKVLDGLTRRRKAEALMFLGGPRGLYQVTASSLNVREGAGTGYSKVGVLYKDDIVTGIAINSDWTWVQLDNGWVSYQYLDFLRPVSGITGLVNKENGVSISWSDDPDADSYHVMRINGDGSAVKIAVTKENSYLDKSVKEGESYTYYVNGVSADKGIQEENPAVTGKTITYYRNPALSSIKAAASGITLKWKAASEAKKYYVYRKTASGAYAKLAETTGVQWTDKTALSGMMYTYTVAYVGPDGSISAYTEKGLSAMRMAATTKVTVSNAAKGMKITWKAVSGITYYQISRKKSGGSWKTIKTGVGGVSYTDTGVSSGKKYRYRVRAIDSTAAKHHSAYKYSSWSYYLKKPVLKVTKASYGGKLKWSKVSGATKMVIYRKIGGGKWKKYATVYSSTVYKDRKTKKGKKYTYRLRAYKGSTKSAYSASKIIKK